MHTKWKPMKSFRKRIRSFPPGVEIDVFILSEYLALSLCRETVQLSQGDSKAREDNQVDDRLRK